MEQIAKGMSGRAGGLYASHTIPDRVPSDFRLFQKHTFDGKEQAVTEYTMSEIVASIYEKIEKTGLKGGNPFYR